MRTCPKCNSILDEIKTKLICSNENCDFQTKKNEFDEIKYPWYKVFCNDETLWEKKVFDEYPAIIAHEYWRLYDLLEHGQTYGAFWQLKDLYEVLLKFPTLIFANAIYAKQERSDVENKVLSTLLSKALSLGDWERVARSICEKCSNSSDFIDDVAIILENVVTLYDDHAITNWRNNTIGHGALGFDDDKEFKHEFHAKIEGLKRHFEYCDVPYSKIKFFIKEDSKMIRLHGKEHAKHIPFMSGEFVIETEKIKQLLFPYIIFHSNSIYIFNYWDREKKTVLLNYLEGKTYHAQHPLPPNREFLELYNVIGKNQMIENIIMAENSIEEKIYSKSDEELLEKISTIDDFESPMYLEKWLKTSLKNNSKGVFLLQMERGMGKTIFAKGLDEQALRKFNFQQHFSIRAYYINNAYLSKIEHFSSKLIFLLCTDKNEHILIQGELPTLSGYSEQKKEDFAHLLNFYQKAYQRFFNKSKFLFIIDGLDEIPPGEGVSVFDFIPTPELLNDGVYLLLTCRTDPELSDFTINHLKTLRITEQICFQRDERKYLDVLECYIKKQMALSTPVEINALMSKAENRFLYLKMLKAVLAIHKGRYSGEFPKGKAIFENFLEYLKMAYGEKFFSGVIRLLSILVTAFEPLTNQEISYLYGEECPTFKLLAYLIDLRGFLNVERSHRGNLISLGHEELKELIEEKYEHAIRKLVEEWIQRCNELNQDVIEIANEGQIYLLAYVARYVNRYLQQMLDSIKIVNTIGNMATILANSSSFVHHKIRALIMFDETVKFGQSLLNSPLSHKKKVTLLISLITAIQNRGACYHALHRLQEAMADFNQAILLTESHLNTEDSDKKRILSKLLTHRGELYDDLKQPQRAETDYTLAIELLQHISGSKEEDALAVVLLNRSYFYLRTQRLSDAIQDSTQAIQILQKSVFSGNSSKNTINNLANAFVTRSGAYFSLRDLHEAVKNSEEAIRIYRNLANLGELKDELARALLNRGNAYSKMQTPENIQKALEDYNEAAVIQQNLYDTGRLSNKNELAMTLTNRAIICVDLQMFEKAIIDYNQAITILKDFHKDGLLLDEGELAKVLVNRGLLYRRQQKYQEAINDYTEAIMIQKKLSERDLLLDECDLARTLMNRCTAYAEIERLEEAFKDKQDALIIIRVLASTRPWLIENYTQCLYFTLYLAIQTRKRTIFYQLLDEIKSVPVHYQLTENAKRWLDKIDNLL